MNGYHQPQGYQPYPAYQHYGAVAQPVAPRFSPVDGLIPQSPLYLIIIIGMVFFLMSNMMPMLMPEARRVM
jgi:hypothetical protein